MGPFIFKKSMFTFHCGKVTWRRGSGVTALVILASTPTAPVKLPCFLRWTNLQVNLM